MGKPLRGRACYYTQLIVCEAKAIRIERLNPEQPDAASPPAVSLTGSERRVVGALAAIYATRMLGLFLPLSVLAIYTAQLPGGSPLMAGLVMGAYPLTQAALQIFFGRWSDRYGRRPVIYLGLALFLLGSVVGAFANTVPLLLVARVLQGAGAISAAVTALLADLVRESLRTRAMAFIGISIGGSFVVSLVAAPWLDTTIGMSGIFWLMGALALLAMALLKWLVPVGDAATPLRAPRDSGSLWRMAVLPGLRRYYIGVFALHFILQATFLAVPLLLVHTLNIPVSEHSKIYLGVFVASLLGTAPLVLASERGRVSKRITVLAIVISALAQVGLALFHLDLTSVVIAFTVFFAVFNFLEARLPAAVSKAAPVADRGAVMGVFATFQVLGSFCGSALAGELMQRNGVAAVFYASGVMAIIWALVVARAAD